MTKKPIIDIIPETRPYVLWRRVSTTKQGESGLGLAAQETIAKTFMGRDPVEVFTDVYSGTKLKQCIALWKAIEFCKENNYVLVIAKTDRFRSVQEALEVLDAVGQNRLIFCDLPTTDRFVLTILWAVWEKQAIIGRLNTKLALAERKKQIEENGGFFSKSGKWTTHLGREKGVELPEAHRAAGKAMMDKAAEWRSKSALYSWVRRQLGKRRSRKDIVAEARELYNDNPELYCTPGGTPLSEAILCKWVREFQKGM